jgi:hypothetical protein
MGKRIQVSDTVSLTTLESDQPANDRNPWRKPRPVPTRCNLCNTRLESYFVNGMTRHGLQKTMCVTCHKEYGIGLGTGHGKLIEIVETAEATTTETVWG